MTAKLSMDQIENIAYDVGASFGYKTEIKTAMFCDLKMRWQRTYDWIKFEISDYLLSLTPACFEELITALFMRLKGDEIEYSPELIEQLQGESFYYNNVEARIERRKIVDHIDYDNEFIYRLSELAEGPMKSAGYSGPVLFGTSIRLIGKLTETSLCFREITFNKDLEKLSDESLKAILSVEFSFLAHADIGDHNLPDKMAMLKKAFEDIKLSDEDRLILNKALGCEEF